MNIVYFYIKYVYALYVVRWGLCSKPLIVSTKKVIKNEVECIFPDRNSRNVFEFLSHAELSQSSITVDVV